VSTIDPDDDDAVEQEQAASAQGVGLIDMHCHLLPGVDDGCKNLRESLECARRLAEAGFTHVFCTPHIWPNLPQNNVATLPAAVEALQHAVNEAGIALRLFPGGESRIGPQTTQTLPDDLVLLNLGQSRGGRFFLFDAWEATWPAYLERAILWLIKMNITPILAHPERCEFFYQDPLNAADRLSEMGVLLQLDGYVIDEKAMARGLCTKPMRRAAERLIEFDYYSFMATDLHRAETLDECLAALDSARELMGSAAFRRVTRRNPIQLLPA
jgi:protein-tyrosine phosphatase